MPAHQGIRNNRGPEPAEFTVARTPIPIRARIDWTTDGEEWVDALAIGWKMYLVRVYIDDARTPGPVWLRASDVHRREPRASGGN